jgi:hypothetical protein
MAASLRVATFYDLPGIVFGCDTMHSPESVVHLLAESFHLRQDIDGG